MAGELSFFELGVEDVERGRAFYEGLFGWDFAGGPSGQGFTFPANEENMALFNGAEMKKNQFTGLAAFLAFF